MTEEEYFERWEAIVARYNAVLHHASHSVGSKRYECFYCLKPPFEIDVSPGLTPKQRSKIIAWAEASIPTWDKLSKG